MKSQEISWQSLAKFASSIFERLALSFIVYSAKAIKIISERCWQWSLVLSGLTRGMEGMEYFIIFYVR